MITPNDWRAKRSLRAIRALADSALAGRITLTNEPVFAPNQHRYDWRYVMGLILCHACEGLGADIPTPPSAPPQPPDACQSSFRPCPDCPLIPQAEDKGEQKGGE